MTDKNRIQQRFQRSARFYDENALVQKEMAKKLIETVQSRCGQQFERILEIGCGTGLLTREMRKKLRFRDFYANDLSPHYEEKIRNWVPGVQFCWGDAETVPFPGDLDLILSNAVFQWFERLDLAFERFDKILCRNGILAFTTFGGKNYQEIKAVTGNSLSYPSFENILELGRRHFLTKESTKSIQTLYFKTPLEILRHIRQTGVNANSQAGWSRSGLSDFEQKYQNFYREGLGYPLTYEPYYFVFQKES